MRRPAFDAWGESVNLASRLEGHAAPGAILISESAFWRLRPHYDIETEGDADLKGIGHAKIYRLKGPKLEASAEPGPVDPVTLAWSRI